MSITRTWALPVIITAAALGCGSDDAAQTEARLTRQAAVIHDSVLALDSHVDIPLDFATAAVDPLDADLQVNLRTMREGGLDAAFFIVYVGQTDRTEENYARARAAAMTKFEAIHRMTEELYPQRIELAETADDVERIHAAGKLAAAIGIENGYVIGKDLSLLQQYHALGARYMTLAHNGHNDIADSATPREDLGDAMSEHGGISEFGRRVILEMNRLGMMVDVSHISKDAALQAIQLSRAPVIASHSSVRALADHRRNLDDDTLRALAERGGVVQIVAYPAFVKVQPQEQQDATRSLLDALGLKDAAEAERSIGTPRVELERGLAQIDERWPPASLADFVDHIDYAVRLLGEDHVGISSDFGGGGGVAGWMGAKETPQVTLELVRRGYTQEQIRKLWSGNLLRVWREAQRAAAQPGADPKQ